MRYYIKNILYIKFVLSILVAFGIFLICREAFLLAQGQDFIQKNITEFVPANYSTPVRIITFIDILNADQHDPDLIDYLKTNVIKPPSGKPYNLLNPNVNDSSQFKQGTFIKSYFKDKKNGLFIEAGALDGELYSNTLMLERQLGWTGLLIEPNPENFINLSSKNRNAHYTQSCISLTASPSTLEISIHFGQSRIIDSSNRETNVYKTAKVNCFPLYSMMVAANITTVDLISLDVESFEVKILKTIPWNAVNIKSFLIEKNYIPEGREYLKQFMAERNYILYRKFPPDYFFIKKS